MYYKLIALVIAVAILVVLVCGCVAEEPVHTQPTESSSTQLSEPVPTQPPELVTVYCLTQLVVQTGDEENQVTDTFTYDTNGNLLTHSEMDGQSDPRMVRTYTYDEQNRILTESWFQNALKREETYSYDSDGKLIRQESWLGGKMLKHSIYSYNAVGQILSELVDYVSEESEDILTTYEYDGRGNLISKLSYYNDSLKTVFSYAYDANGNMVTELYVANGTVQRARAFSYDEKGYLIREEVYASAIYRPLQSLPVLVLTYTYDEQGNLLQEQSCCLENGEETVTTTKWTYDDRGNMLSETAGSIVTQWTYDEWGNILSYRYYSLGELKYEILYSYVAFQVTPAHAEKIRLQQADYTI